MNKLKYIIRLYTIFVIIIACLIFITCLVRIGNQEKALFTSLFSFNQNDKLNYSEIITSDTNLIYKNIELQLSKIQNDSLKIIKHLTNNDNRAYYYSDLIKFSLNSFLLMRISVEGSECPNDSTIEVQLTIKNFNNLQIKLVFCKEHSNYKLTNISNINPYLQHIDKLYRDNKIN